MSQINEEVIKKAAKWWRDEIGSPKVKDNSARDKLNTMAHLLGSSMPSNYQPTDEQLDTFQKSLEDQIRKFAVPNFCLGCDYHPDVYLRKAADDAGINTSLFPWKTRMYINERTITVYALGENQEI